MKILLLNPPLFDASKYGKKVALGSTPYIGMANLGAVLEQAGFEVKIYDLYYYSWSHVEEILQKEVPDIIGISCFTEPRKSAFILAELSKRILPKTKIVMGGPHASHLFEQVLTHYPVDIVVVGEGEITVVELVKAIEQNVDLAEVKGIAYSTDGHIVKTPERPLISDLDSLPFPAYHLFHDIDIYSDEEKINTYGNSKYKDKLQNYRLFGVMSSRGCPHRCQFCATTKFWGSKWRLRSAENVVDEIEYIYNRYNVRFVTFNDDAFTINRQRVIDICKEILERKLDIVWTCTTRADSLDQEVLDWMKRAGCHFCSFGVESGSPEILKNINKKVTPEKLIQGFELMGRADIKSSALMMVGNPGESKVTIKQTVDFLSKIKADSVSVAITMVFPATELYYLAESKGLIDSSFWLTDLPAPYYTAENSIEQLHSWELEVLGENRSLTGHAKHLIRKAFRLFGLKIDRLDGRLRCYRCNNITITNWRKFSG